MTEKLTPQERTDLKLLDEIAALKKRMGDVVAVITWDQQRIKTLESSVSEFTVKLAEVYAMLEGMPVGTGRNPLSSFSGDEDSNGIQPPHPAPLDYSNATPDGRVYLDKFKRPIGVRGYEPPIVFEEIGQPAKKSYEPGDQMFVKIYPPPAGTESPLNGKAFNPDSTQGDGLAPERVECRPAKITVSIVKDPFALQERIKAERLAEIDAELAELGQRAGKLRGERERLRNP